MSNIESQIQKRLNAAEADLGGAQDLIDAHLDEVSGGGFSLHVQFGTKQPKEPKKPVETVDPPK